MWVSVKLHHLNWIELNISTQCTVEYTRWQWGLAKGVGPGMILAWPGWKQSVIAVEVDTGRLETSRFKKCYANCVLLYFPSTEIKSAFNVYLHGGGAAGLSCTELSIWEFPFLRGVCWQGWTSLWYCEKGMPQKDTLDNLRTPVPEFIDPVLGMKMIVFAKTRPNRSFSI